MFKPPHNNWSAYMFCVVNLQVFFCVVFYGLFHGLCYLPVILSCIGPSPYNSSRVHSLQLSTTSLNPVDCPGAIGDCSIDNNNSKIILSKSYDLSLLNPEQMVLPWQPDQSLDTDNGDHVTKNKTVASTGETHNHDRNFRRSIAGKEYIANVSSSKWFLRGTSNQTQQRRRVSWESWVFCWIVCGSFVATLSQALCLDCLWRKRG